VAAAVVAIAAIVIVGVVATPGGRSTFTTSGSIARVHIDGLIRSDNDRVEALERLEKSRAAAVVVHVNSPGGTTAGSEQLYDALVRLKAKKPLVVVVEGLAASGGYITAIAADRRAVPVSEFHRIAENRRRQGRRSEVFAAESGA
jgi:protease-4